MTWGKVSDELHDDEKWRAASKGGRALWVTALSWCASKGNGGRIPKHMLSVLDGTRAEAKSLVDVGLWDLDEQGWAFHDWDDYNESEEVARARREKRAAAAAEANHVRWHVRKGVRIDSCALCIASDSDRSSDALPESDRNPPVPVPGPVLEEVPEGGEPKQSRPTPAPWCSRHPGGTDAACGPCRTARLVWEQTITEADNADKAKPTPGPWSCNRDGHQPHPHLPGVCRHCGERIEDAA